MQYKFLVSRRSHTEKKVVGNFKEKEEVTPKTQVRLCHGQISCRLRFKSSYGLQVK